MTNKLQKVVQDVTRDLTSTNPGKSTLILNLQVCLQTLYVYMYAEN